MAPHELPGQLSARTDPRPALTVPTRTSPGDANASGTTLLRTIAAAVAGGCQPGCQPACQPWEADRQPAGGNRTPAAGPQLGRGARPCWMCAGTGAWPAAPPPTSRRGTRALPETRPASAERQPATTPGACGWSRFQARWPAEPRSPEREPVVTSVPPATAPARPRTLSPTPSGTCRPLSPTGPPTTSHPGIARFARIPCPGRSPSGWGRRSVLRRHPWQQPPRRSTPGRRRCARSAKAGNSTRSSS